jgi:phosphoglycolate phosphatase-like HAD superfamily hydrolase
MLCIVELDGVIFDLRGAVWTAYSQAVEKIGMARTDEATLWRLVRTAAPDAQWVRNARPHQLSVFREAFDQALESDEIIRAWLPHDDVRDTVTTLRRIGDFAAATCGANLAAREQCVRHHGLADTFPKITGIPRSAADARPAWMRLRGDERVVAVLGATVSMIRSADDAGLTPIGISSGPAIGKRLAGAGARAVYRDVPEFAAALQAGDEALRRAGLIV